MTQNKEPENTVLKFKSFYCTQHYYPVNTQYAITDGAKYLFDRFDSEVSHDIIQKIIAKTTYINCFTSTDIIIQDKTVTVKITDGNNKDLYIEVFNTEHRLDNGTYRLFCYHYVILAANEY